jgi:hypothetical protein
MISRWFRSMTFRTLVVKAIMFLVPWCLSLFAILHFYPNLIDVSKLITTIFSNTLVFLIIYILTVVGFQYSDKGDNDG